MNIIRSSPFTLLSPKEILTGTKLDHKRDLCLSFGDFVQVNVPNSSDPLSEKTTSCIDLQPCMDQCQSMFFFSLQTKDVIKRNAWTVMPITDPVVHFITQLSKGKTPLFCDELIGDGKPSVVQPDQRALRGHPSRPPEHRHTAPDATPRPQLRRPPLLLKTRTATNDASYTATSSPTMSITSLYILCNLLLDKEMQFATDVVGAYLNAEND
jgi:hypothetical protein